MQKYEIQKVPSSHLRVLRWGRASIWAGSSHFLCWVGDSTAYPPLPQPITVLWIPSWRATKEVFSSLVYNLHLHTMKTSTAGNNNLFASYYSVNFSTGFLDIFKRLKTFKNTASQLFNETSTLTVEEILIC